MFGLSTMTLLARSTDTRWPRGPHWNILRIFYSYGGYISRLVGAFRRGLTSPRARHCYDSSLIDLFVIQPDTIGASIIIF